MPSSRQARMTRTAISPRLAIRTFRNMRGNATGGGEPRRSVAGHLLREVLVAEGLAIDDLGLRIEAIGLPGFRAAEHLLRRSVPERRAKILRRMLVR